MKESLLLCKDPTSNNAKGARQTPVKQWWRALGWRGPGTCPRSQGQPRSRASPGTSLGLTPEPKLSPFCYMASLGNKCNCCSVFKPPKTSSLFSLYSSCVLSAVPLTLFHKSFTNVFDIEILKPGSAIIQSLEISVQAPNSPASRGPRT